MHPIEMGESPDFRRMAETYRSLAGTEPHALQAALFAAIAEDYSELAAASGAPTPLRAEVQTDGARGSLFARWLRMLHFRPAVPTSSQA